MGLRVQVCSHRWVARGELVKEVADLVEHEVVFLQYERVALDLFADLH